MPTAPMTHARAMEICAFVERYHHRNGACADATQALAKARRVTEARAATLIRLAEACLAGAAPPPDDPPRA
jgi:hypothetical protein